MTDRRAPRPAPRRATRPAPRPRGSRWRWLILGPFALCVIGVGVVYNPLQLLPEAEPEAATPPRGTAPLSVRDLERDFEAEGEIRFVSQRTVTNSQPGVISELAATAQPIEAGDVLYIRNDQPIVYLAGEIPAWRTMQLGDVGGDVAQLEQNLFALGYGDGFDFTVDDTFTSVTRSVVEAWQADIGVDQTGVVVLDSVVFGPAQGRVGTVTATVGSAANASPIMVVTGREREASFTVTADLVDDLPVGTEVNLRLPDRSNTTGRVTTLTPIGGGVWEAIATLDQADPEDQDAAADGSSAGQLLPAGDAIPIAVTWTRVVVREALTAPAGAFTRVDGGGYVLEVVRADGSTEFIAVEAGERYGTVVEITSELDPDLVVIAP